MGILIEDRSLRDKLFVFKDWKDAGLRITEKLAGFLGSEALVLSVPSGGVPIVNVIAAELGLKKTLLVVVKVSIPKEPDLSIGAVGPDGSVILNKELIAERLLSKAVVEYQVEVSKKIVKKRNEIFREGRAFPNVEGREVIVADDGIVSGYTLLTSIAFLKTLKPSKITVVVATGNEETIEKVVDKVDELICLNIRGGRYGFQVADSYKDWHLLNDNEILKLIYPRDWEQKYKIYKSH